MAERSADALPYAEAERSFARLAALDDPSISPEGRSRFFTHGERRPLSLVLLHGLTSAPAQWDVFASEAFARGANVVVPRMPGHGAYDRETRSVALVTAAHMTAVAARATDIAAAAGGRVVVAGLSLGGTLAARLALDRSDVARAVSIAPLVGLAHLADPLDALVAAALQAAPNAFVPWSPGGDRGQVPRYGYPRFPTRLLGRSLALGRRVAADARTATIAGEFCLVLNANEPAIGNAAARSIAVRLARRRPSASTVTVLEGLPRRHDIIDPTEAGARIDLVYPALHALTGFGG